jgi:hypothetical protein
MHGRPFVSQNVPLLPESERLIRAAVADLSGVESGTEAYHLHLQGPILGEWPLGSRPRAPEEALPASSGHWNRQRVMTWSEAARAAIGHRRRTPPGALSPRGSEPCWRRRRPSG